jgi:diguanylate cyclase
MFMQRVFTAVPSEIADDFNLLLGARLQKQTSWLSFALLLTVPITIYAASEGASVWIRIVLPIFIGVLFLVSLVSSQLQYGGVMNPVKAKKFIADTNRSTPFIAGLCSLWCVFSWINAPVETKSYYPLILAMGSLTTVYCLSSVRLAAILNLLIGILPITLLMMFSGSRLDFAASLSLLIAGSFLLHMIFAQHNQWVDLLLLKRKMQNQANTDPLTGLLNRRALDARLQQEIDFATEDSIFSLALLDLDGFKPVNDRYGHAVGDELLCEIGVRLKQACVDDAIVARYGGDEFAILLPADLVCDRANLADQIITSLVTPFKISGHPIRIGASIGVAHWPQDGRNINGLLESADRALYAVKALSKSPRVPSNGARQIGV